MLTWSNKAPPGQRWQSEGNVQRVDVTAVDGTDWHAQLCQVFDDLQEGETYTIRFRAKADAPRRMKLCGDNRRAAIGIASVWMKRCR